jgi:sigma-B regulation protein RsbQ
VMVFAHGFGCDQNMWRSVAPAFEDRFTTILFDHVGAGKSDLAAYDAEKYASLSGYADDVVEIARELNLKGAVFVGHSVSAMIGVLASLKAPELFGTLVLIGPSPRYINDRDYVGGLAPVIMSNADRPELGEELTNSFCRTDPVIAKAFARVTFTSDNRADLDRITARVLILQCSDDVIAPEEVGAFVQRRIPGSTLVLLEATGHCPNLSAPDETIAAIRDYVG